MIQPDTKHRIKHSWQYYDQDHHDDTNIVCVVLASAHCDKGLHGYDDRNVEDYKTHLMIVVVKADFHLLYSCVILQIEYITCCIVVQF